MTRPDVKESDAPAPRLTQDEDAPANARQFAPGEKRKKASATADAFRSLWSED